MNADEDAAALFEQMLSNLSLDSSRDEEHDQDDGDSSSFRDLSDDLSICRF